MRSHQYRGDDGMCFLFWTGDCVIDSQGHYTLKADIAFLIDQDNDITDFAFQHMLNLVKETIKPFQIGPNDLQVAG